MNLIIFFSWQEPTDSQGFNNKKFLLECINKAAKEIKNKGKLKGVGFEVREGLGKVPGTPDVAQKMYEQIDMCDIFIGDFTIQTPLYKWYQRLVYKIGRQQLPRREPNSNVLSEYSRALGKETTFEEQCILLLNTVNGDPKEDANLINFDNRGRRHPIKFFMDKDTNPEAIKGDVVNDLKVALQESAEAALVNKGKKYEPYISWKKLSKDKSLMYAYVETEDLKLKKHQLLDNEGVIRLLGLSGMGKTRLVLEAFKGQDKNMHFLYADCNKYEEGAVFEKTKMLFEEYEESVLVLDNCESDFLLKIMRKRSEYGAANPIIAIYYDPKEEKNSGTSQIVIHKADDDYVVRTILSRISNLSDEKRDRIAEFASGNPKMAELLVEGIRDGKEIGDLGDNELMSRLLQTDENSKERIFLRSLSLFRYVGFKEERRSELESIIKSKDITSINYLDEQVLMNDCDATIKSYQKREILETKGRLIGVRPLPLSFKLAKEWLQACTSERMLKVVNDITQMKDSKVLIRSFHAQFKNLRFVDEAQQMVSMLLSQTNSPFESAEVINTEMGSQLFRTFVEVNPESVADLLYRVLEPLSTEKLKKIEDGRRNLVWTIEKLCFDKVTFLKGAYLMMRLGVAENESWANNATADFISLFPVLLPATSADLNTRLTFLKQYVKNEEFRPLIFKALRSALKVRDFIYMGGAESQGTKKLENYRPKTYEEIRSYFSGCLDLIYGEIKDNGICKDSALEILEKVTPNLCRAGYTGIILPIVYEVADILRWDWDAMQSSLLMFKYSLMQKLSEKDKVLYKDILDKLTKYDIVSVFRNVQKENYAQANGKNFNEIEKGNQRRYRELAERFCHAYNRKDLQGLMSSENILIHPFGYRLYEVMDDSQKDTFLKDSVDILNHDKDAKDSILLDFMSAGKESDLQHFAPVIRRLNNKDIIFEVYGRLRVEPDSSYFQDMVDLIKNKQAEVSSFNKYWINLPLGSQSKDKVLQFFNIVLSLPNGLSTILHMSSFLTLGGQKDLQDIADLLVNAIMERDANKGTILQLDGLPLIATSILKNYQEDNFARFMHHELIIYLEKTDNIIINNYDITQLYEVLIDKYFGIIWQELAKSIVSQNILLFLHINEVIGTSFSNEGDGLLFKKDHHQEFLQLCKDYPKIAPMRIIHMAPPYGQDGFSDLVLEILQNYGDQQEALDELSAKMGSFSSSGSVIPNLVQQKETLETLLSFNNDTVVKWAKQEITSLNIQIKKWREIEEEPMM